MGNTYMSHTSNRSRHIDRRLLLPALLAGLVLALPAAAQRFESHYGESTTADHGADIKAVHQCPGGGSILAGTRRVPAVGNETLVTRVDDNGVSIWQFAYRVAQSRDTRGEAIVELSNGDGFAVTGSFTRGNADRFIYVLRLNCFGRPLWTTMLGNLSHDHYASGHDIIESPNPFSPTIRPDLVVVGEEVRPGPPDRSFGRIARLDQAGNVLWDNAYRSTNHALGLRFRAVTGAAGAGAIGDDLVVAGSLADGSDWQFERRALMFRTNAGGTPVCNSYLGIPGTTSNEDFNGITALRLPQTLSGSPVLVGASGDPNSPNNDAAYLVRFRPLACDPVVQALYIEPPHGAAAIGHDLVEVAAGSVNLPPGTLAVTGRLFNFSPQGDGFALLANPLDLGPLWTPMRYGVHGARTERLVAIDRKGDHLVMAGSTSSDWAGSGDPQDFYMVQTRLDLRTNCSARWHPIWQPITMPHDRFAPQVLAIQFHDRVPTELIDTRGEGYACRP